MSDFHQRGLITTLPRLRDRPIETIEAGLARHVEGHPLALLIPALAAEMERPALAKIVREVAKARYLDTVLISLDRADASQYERGLEYFRGLRHRTVVLWNDAPAIVALRQEVEKQIAAPIAPGKGRAVWMAFGYLLAEGRCKAVALHDADVVDYDRTLLANLVLPVVHPQLRFDFCKGYYARFTDRLHGRVTRLLIRPFLQALGDLVGRHPFLSYLEAFRYPLAGEIALDTDLVRLLRLPGDWGLEVGTLSEVLRHRSPRRICQAEIADGFEHKHQPLSPGDPGRGLHRMAVDIVQHLLRTLAAAGVAINQGWFNSMRVSYQRHAEDAIATYDGVAAFNALLFDRHAEERAVETFSRALAEACDQFVVDPFGTPALPNWARVVSAMPETGARLAFAVRQLDGVLAA
jgi:glucosyl-3-phosphoglycerate synthase